MLPGSEVGSGSMVGSSTADPPELFFFPSSLSFLDFLDLSFSLDLSFDFESRFFFFDLLSFLLCGMREREREREILS